jgi:hypothetical protein
MKQVRELIVEIERQIELSRSCCDSVEDFLADKLESVATSLKAAIAPDWRLASEPPDSPRQVWLLWDGESVIGWYSKLLKAYKACDDEQLLGVTHWHEIEVHEPPEVNQ